MKINSTQFLEILHNGILRLDDKTISFQKSPEELEFNNIEFTEKLEINIDFQKNRPELKKISFKETRFSLIDIRNSEWHGIHLLFEESTIESFSWNSSKYLKTLEIHDCIINNISFINLACKVVFISDSEINSFHISSEGDIPVINDFIFNKNTVESKFWMGEYCISNQLTITSSTFRDEFILISLILMKLQLRSKIEADVSIINCQCIELFGFGYGSEFKGNFNILGGRFNEIHIDYGSLNTVRLLARESITINKLRITDLADNSLFSENAAVGELILEGQINQVGTVSIKKSNIVNIRFENLQNDGRIKLDTIGNSPSLKDIKFYSDSTPPSEFSIISSDLGKTYLFNCDFKHFNKIKVIHSSVSEVITTITRFPTFDERKIETNESGEFNALEQEDLYNQLLQSAIKASNKKDEVIFYREYLEFHRRNKLRELAGANFIKKLIKLDWYTPISLWTHKVSSNYGTNWVRAGVLTLLLMSILFLAYINSLHFKEEITWQEKWKLLIVNIWTFISPIHGNKIIDSSVPGAFTGFIDFLSRIVSSFMIYQVVTAYRRFGRK